MSHTTQPAHSSTSMTSRLFPATISHMFARLGSNIARALNVMMPTLGFDRFPPTTDSSRVSGVPRVNAPVPQLVPSPFPPAYFPADYHDIHPPAYEPSGGVLSIPLTVIYPPPYPGTGVYSYVDLEAGLRTGQRFHPVTTALLGDRATVLPQTSDWNLWRLPEIYKRVLLFIACIVMIIGCIVIAVMIPKMHKHCDPCDHIPPQNRNFQANSATHITLPGP